MLSDRDVDNENIITKQERVDFRRDYFDDRTYVTVWFTGRGDGSLDILDVKVGRDRSERRRYWICAVFRDNNRNLLELSNGVRQYMSRDQC